MRTIWILLGILNLFHGPAFSRRTTDKPGYKEYVPKTSTSTQLGKWPTLSGDPTLLMAHRGEKVFMPEHTLGSYEFASIEGADFVEPDLVLTKDGFLVCFHDLTLKTGTDVSTRPEFAHLMTNFTGIIDEDVVTITEDWFIKDFNLDQLKTLRVVQKSIGIRPQLFNDFFQIPTFEEYLDIVHHNAHKLKKAIGIIPELKHSKFHNSLPTLPTPNPNYIEDLLLTTLTSYGYPLTPNATSNCTSPMYQYASIPCGHLIIQSFESNSLKYLSTQTSVEKMMLINKQFPLLTFQGIQEIATFSQYYSLWKELLYTGILAQIASEGLTYNETLIESMGGFIPPKSIVSEAHALGLKVGIYTLYDSREPSHRGCTVQCDPENKEMELFYYFDMGVDGMFVENIPEAREIRMKYHYEVVNSIRDRKSKSSKGFRVDNSITLLILSLMLYAVVKHLKL